MKRILIPLAIALSVPLTACGGVGTGVASPGQIATVSADNAFVAAVNAGLQRVHDGKMTSAEFQELRETAYASLLLVRSASTTAELIAAQAKLADAERKLKTGQ